MELEKPENDTARLKGLSPEIVFGVERQWRIEFILKTYFVLGIVFALVSAFYFYLSSLKVRLTDEQIYALIVAGTGLFFSTLSGLALAFRRQRVALEAAKLMESTYRSELVEAWAEFENLSRQILSAESEEFNRYSVRSMISKLEHEGRISKTDLMVLQEALEVRNQIVHAGGRFTSEQLHRHTIRLADIIAKLSRKLVKSEKI